jgi:catechol 2,3-dioxygenase-like lactoylglutathione lyase family enzyme
MVACHLSIISHKIKPFILIKEKNMLHHLSFGVTDIQRSAVFYDAVFAPLGYFRVWEDFEGDDAAVGYGIKDGGDKFAIKLCKHIAIGQGFHLAFSAANRAAVDAFYIAALANGGKDNGPAGLRPDYGEHYYAAFVIDPDGYRIEAVINTPPQ